MHCARRICILSFTYTSGEQISTASIYTWIPGHFIYTYVSIYMYVCMYVYTCTYGYISLLSVCTERWCSELLLLDAEPLPPARVHCIIQFWSLAIKKRNKGRTIVLAHRRMNRGRHVQYSSHQELFYVRGCSIDACVFGDDTPAQNIPRDFLLTMRDVFDRDCISKLGIYVCSLHFKYSPNSYDL